MKPPEDPTDEAIEAALDKLAAALKRQRAAAERLNEVTKRCSTVPAEPPDSAEVDSL